MPAKCSFKTAPGGVANIWFFWKLNWQWSLLPLAPVLIGVVLFPPILIGLVLEFLVPTEAGSQSAKAGLGRNLSEGENSNVNFYESTRI